MKKAGRKAKKVGKKVGKVGKKAGKLIEKAAPIATTALPIAAAFVPGIGQAAIAVQAARAYQGYQAAQKVHHALKKNRIPRHSALAGFRHRIRMVEPAI